MNTAQAFFENDFNPEVDSSKLLVVVSSFDVFNTVVDEDYNTYRGYERVGRLNRHDIAMFMSLKFTNRKMYHLRLLTRFGFVLACLSKTCFPTLQH